MQAGGGGLEDCPLPTAHCPLPCLLSVGFLSVASRHFRNKKKGYLKAKIEELENNSKIKNIRDLYRGINDFKKGTSLELI